MASELPPIYSPEDTNYPASSDDGEQLHSSATAVLDSSLQLLISPSSLDAFGFQNGFVGAEGEHAAIEGEVQIKSLSGHWQKVTVSLRSVETAYGHDEIVLADTTQVLFESPPPADHSSTRGEGVSTVPSTLPFAIPLPDDTPQCVHTAKSSLTHTLIAALYAADATAADQATTATVGATSVVRKSLVIHPKRYRSHGSTIAIAPQTHVLASPTRVEIQVPRTTFSSDESIPIYVTVPPPSREVVVDRGLRIRNVRAELFRVVRIQRSSAEQGYSSESSSSDEDGEDDEDDQKSEHGLQVPSSQRIIPPDSASSPSTSKAPILPAHDYPSNDYWSINSDSYRTIISRSGGSCRFHSTRPLRLRFVLHPPSPDDSPSTFQMNASSINSEGTLTSNRIQYVEGDIRCASITQATLLHSVRFGIKVGVSFVDTTNRREITHWVHIPVTLVAPAAPLPEVDADIDAAYQKKHDRPPAQTVRMPDEDAESSAPHYYNHYFEEGQAGPSAFGFPGAGEGPPPFDDDREAPPPFFEGPSSSAAAAAAGTVMVATTNQSNNNHLPTFQESEREIFIPVEDDEQGLLDAAAVFSIEGEGTLFGFSASEQFDGQIVNDDVYRATTPPPTLEQATLDTDVTELATIQEPVRAMEALGMVLEQQQQQHDEVLSSSSGMGPDDEPPPPPPPAMDDPSDPPPSIDSDFRSPVGSGGGGSSSGGLISVERHSPPPLAHHHDDPPPPLSPLSPPPLLPPPLPPHHRHHHDRPPSFSEGSLTHSLTDSSLPPPPLPPPPDGIDSRTHGAASGGVMVVPTTGHAPPPYLVQGEDSNQNHGHGHRHGHGQVPVQSGGGARTGGFSMSMRPASASHAHDSHAAAGMQIQNNNSHPPPYVDHLPPPPLPLPPPPPPSHR